MAKSVIPKHVVVGWGWAWLPLGKIGYYTAKSQMLIKIRQGTVRVMKMFISFHRGFPFVGIIQNMYYYYYPK